jgi:hypothetical protein
MEFLNEKGRPSATAVEVYNNTGTTMSAGALVYIYGFNAANNCPTVALADGTDATKPAQLVMRDNLSTAQKGWADTVALITQPSTNSRTVGDVCYLSVTAPGGIQWAAPTAAGHQVQPVGVCAVVGIPGTVYFTPGISFETQLGSTGIPNGSITNAKLAATAVTEAVTVAKTFTNASLSDSAGIRSSQLAAGTDSTFIWVSASTGNDTTGSGSNISPYATITKAFSVVTDARKTIYVLPGVYTEAHILTWPNFDGVRLIGLDWGGNVTITYPADAGAEVILINPTFTTATLSAFIENVLLYHGNSKKGVVIDNENMGSRKLMVYLLNMPTYGSGTSIDISHTTTDQAIRLYAVNCDEVSGLVNITTKTTDDRFRFRGCSLMGGLTTSADAIGSEVTLLDCVVLTGALTIGDTAQVKTYRGCCYRTGSPATYTALTDGYSVTT